MQTLYFFNKYVYSEYYNNSVPYAARCVLLFNNGIFDYKNTTHQERIDKINEINFMATHSQIDQKSLKTYLMNHVYSFNHKIINPIFEIRLKYLKYRELDTDEEKKIFYDAQRKYQVLYRFINKIKFNKMRKFDNEYDLCMVPLSSFPPKQTIWLFENMMRFQYNVRDLLNVIISALSSSFFMFETSKNPKNPFTNVELTVFQLNLIYIRLCELKIKIPLLFELFYRANFVLSKFKRDNARFLTQCAIESHYRKDVIASNERLIDVLEMIRDYCNPFMKIRFHKEFPIQTIYNVFRPYLILRAKWVAFNCVASKAKLENGLKIFHAYNPLFGYKYICKDGSIGFDNRHISYGDLFNCKYYNEDTKSMIEIGIENKNKYGSIYCTGILPIDDVQYILFKLHIGSFVNNDNDLTEEDEDEEEEYEEEEEQEDSEDEEDEGDYDP